MAYRRFNRGYGASNPQVRTLVAKYAGKCACCGAMISAGTMVDYYPVGTIAGVTEARIAHTGGLDGNSARCSAGLRRAFEEKAVNDYAGDGLDERWEDQGRDICGA